MVCNVKDLQAQELLQTLVHQVQGTEDEDTLSHMQTVLGKGKNDPVVSKLLQSRSRYGIAVETDPGKYVLVLGDTLTNPQAMGRANASCLVACLLRAGTLPLAAQKFKVQCRATTSDKAGYNLLAENTLQQQRGCMLFLQASMRCAPLGHMRRQDIGIALRRDIQGPLRSALSVQVGTYMCTFRTALTQVIKTKLIFCKGILPGEALKYKEHVLDLFHATLSYRSKKVCLLMRVMNGDWRDHKHIQYYTDKVDSLQNKELVLQWMTSVLLEVYVSRKPFVYPRHRWTGSDRSIDWVGAMEICHGLFTATYTQFLQLLAKPSTSRASHPPATVNLPVPEAEVDDGDHGFAPFPMAGDADLEVDETDYPDPDMPHAVVDHAALLAKDRWHAQQWISGGILANLHIMRTVLEPMQEMLTAQFHLNSSEFELEQQAMACQQGPGEGVRHFMLTKAASQEIEKNFFAKITTLFNDPGKWSHLPDPALTTKNNCKIFRLLSRSGCLVHQLYAHNHTIYPTKVFRLLHEPHMAHEVQPQDPQSCLLDPWSSKMAVEHADWSSPLFRSVLLVHCALCATDISSIEARHASMRRHLKGRSVQVSPMSMLSLGSQWVFQFVRRQKVQVGKKVVSKGKWSHVKVVSGVVSKMCWAHLVVRSQCRRLAEVLGPRTAGLVSSSVAPQSPR